MWKRKTVRKLNIFTNLEAKDWPNSVHKEKRLVQKHRDMGKAWHYCKYLCNEYSKSRHKSRFLFSKENKSYGQNTRWVLICVCGPHTRYTFVLEPLFGTHIFQSFAHNLLGLNQMLNNRRLQNDMQIESFKIHSLLKVRVNNNV